MVQIVINKELSSACPSLQEIEPSMVNISPDETIEVRWDNSRQEQVALERHRNRKFLLYVPDLQACERATGVLELPLTLGKNLIGDARLALTNKKLYNWREFSKDKGTTVTKNILLKIAADEIRNGNRPKLAGLAKDMFLDGVSPTNADTLLRLRIWNKVGA
jgi:hypothetical protein